MYDFSRLLQRPKPLQFRFWVRLPGTVLKRIDLERQTEHVATCRSESVEEHVDLTCPRAVTRMARCCFENVVNLCQSVRLRFDLVFLFC